ncbi:MAG: MarR family transcriptional regulator [Deltaproteobacteria bacterium]|nr:MAG: MarR family transcriptional regulator [Deltaproteobacteria bacterium]
MAGGRDPALAARPATVAVSPRNRRDAPDASPVERATAQPRSRASPKPSPATRYDLRVLQALRRMIRAVDLHSRKLSAQHNVTGPQLVCLLAIEEHEPVTASAIARHVHLSQSTVIGILDRLEAKKLVRRQRNLEDRRVVHVSLTEQGRALARNAPSPLHDALATAMTKLPESELGAIAASLDRIAEMMEDRHSDAAPILDTEPVGSTAGAAETVPPGDQKLDRWLHDCDDR